MITSRWAARPRNWAITAAALAVLVCGAIWPLPVVGAGGALVAAWALVHGIRLAFTEQPAARPDPSGPDPETVRTDPDTTAQATTEQAGHDPDALRTRVALAIRRDLKARTAPALVDFSGRPIPGTEIGLTEYDIADVALAEITAAGYCPHCGRGDLAPTADDWAQQAARAVQAEAAITRVRELHVRNANTRTCEPCSADAYPDYEVPWPCPTIRALGAIPAEGNSR